MKLNVNGCGKLYEGKKTWGNECEYFHEGGIKSERLVEYKTRCETECEVECETNRGKLLVGG